MVKKSTKSKSKRVTLGEKYTRIRKAKQKLVKDKRKATKEAKQRALQGGRKPKNKDPGVPAAWPFREEFLKEMAFERAKILAKKQKEKEARKARKQALLAGEPEEEVDALEALKAEADQRQEGFEGAGQAEAKPSGSSGRSGSDRAFYKEFKRVVELADVVIEVLDARDPMACRSLEVENFVRTAGPEKRVILLLNKIDLVPHTVVETWLKYLREEIPAIAFKSSTQKQHHNIGQARKVGLGQDVKTQMCLGAENLLQLLKNYARNKNIKTAITVGIVGMPNVGKSSVINSLKRTRVAHVGNRPGVTTSIQEVHLDKHIRLLDSPGIIVTKGQGPLQGGIKTEQVDDPIGIVNEILSKVLPERLAEIYQVDTFQTAEEFLQHLAAARGKLRRGGLPDMGAVAKMVLQDWNSGVIPYYTTPPERLHGKSVRLVEDWADEFNINEIGDKELLASVKSMQELEDSVMDAMSGMDLVKTTDKKMEAAADLVEKFSLAGNEDKTGGAVTERDGKEDGGGSVPFTFQGGEAAFDKMAKQNRDRKEMGNVVKSIEGLLMEGGIASENGALVLGDAKEEEVVEPERPKKKRRRKPEKPAVAAAAVAPKPKGLEEDQDEDSDDGKSAVPAPTPMKRKKPTKKSKGTEYYGAEGQFDAQQARTNRKKLKKVKKRQQKTNAEAGKLADAVGQVIRLGDS